MDLVAHLARENDVCPVGPRYEMRCPKVYTVNVLAPMIESGISFAI